MFVLTLIAALPFLSVYFANATEPHSAPYADLIRPYNPPSFLARHLQGASKARCMPCVKKIRDHQASLAAAKAKRKEENIRIAEEARANKQRKLVSLI